MTAQPSSFITPDALLEHWQGHRRLTRRVIDAFPDDRLFTFSVGDMRPFGKLAQEMLGMGAPMLQGIVTDTWDWKMSQDQQPKGRAEMSAVARRQPRAFSGLRS